MILLTILIPSVPSRRKTFLQQLLDNLEKQVGDNEHIEILNLYDNKRMTIGEKRNMLLSMARGKYLTFVDDDDTLAPNYISEIMKVINEYEQSGSNLDCITFIQDCYINNVHTFRCKYSKDFEYTSNKQTKEWTGKPAHTMIWASKIAKNYTYPHLQNGEDYDWCKRACLDIKDQVMIDKVLYTYYYNRATSETSDHIKSK